MTRLRSNIRRFGSTVVLVATLLLTGTLWVVGTHHHDPATGHTCTVCTTAHAPAIVSITASNVVVPRLVATPVLERAHAAPAAFAIGIAPSRAPPLA